MAHTVATLSLPCPILQGLREPRSIASRNPAPALSSKPISCREGGRAGFAARRSALNHVSSAPTQGLLPATLGRQISP